MLRVLVDNGIVSASDFAEGAIERKPLRWGTGTSTVEITGFQRVPLDTDPTIQREKDALFTIGRSAREGNTELYTYFELQAEQWRRNRGRDFAGNAFRGCALKRCEAALVRSSYFQGISMDAAVAKGGKKDRRNGVDCGVSQIAFFKFLLDLRPENVEQLIALGPPTVSSDFDRASLSDLAWFQHASRIAPSEENLPDFFHLWTAKRNAMDVFLTLEKKLPQYAVELKRRGLLGDLSVMRPTELVGKLGVTELDPVPLEPGKFYTFDHLMGRHFVGWER